MSKWSFTIVALCLLIRAADAAGPLRPEDESRKGRLVVTVADQTGAVIPDAALTVTREDGGGAAVPVTARTGPEGTAVIADLPDGRYTIQAEFPGFATHVLQDVRVRGGDTRRRMTLAISKLDQQVTVSRDAQSTSLDPRGSAFSNVLTREQIDALPDDPDEMEDVLSAMAPPGSRIRVDGFSGGRLPPKSQIRSIRLPRLDMFAAQNHGGMFQAMFIDIMTSPGNGPLRGSIDGQFADDTVNARNPFTMVKPDEGLQRYGFSLSGTIRPDKTSFSVSGGASWQFTSPNLLARLPDGTTRTETIRQPRDTGNVSARIDHAFTKDHVARVSLDRSVGSSRTMGVGGYNLFERAFDTENDTTMIRLSENGPLGRRYFTESRVQLRWTSTSTDSRLEAPTVRVQDAFTSGGAQQRGGRDTFDLELASDLDYVRGAHSWRAGVLIEASRSRSDDMSNYLGTYTFANLDDYLAGRASNYTRRVGDPALRYSAMQGAAYLQDDWRVNRGLLVSAGLRLGAQNHTTDHGNLSPRISAAWSPHRNGRLTVRGSYGYFYDWIATDLYKQALQVDGVRQREINVLNPTYPALDLDAAGTTLPTNRYRWSDDLTLPTAHRLTVGVERNLAKNSQLTMSYSRGWGRGLLRGRNLNTPVDGLRPDTSIANDVALVSDAASRSASFSASINVVRLDWKRTFVMAYYNWNRSRTNTPGAYALPANGDTLSTEWGPSADDVRHRGGFSLGSTPFTNTSVSLNARIESGRPYDITTGRDDNRDGVFNDRPTGVGRNAARGDWTVDLSGRISYGLGFGPVRQAGGGTMIQISTGDSAGGGFGPGGGGNRRFRIDVYLSGQNLLNRANYTAFSFVQSSPFYGQPVAAATPRKIQAGVRFGF